MYILDNSIINAHAFVASQMMQDK